MKKVVTLGGGTGSFTVLTGLKEFPYELTSIISVTDSGGSTGKLRDEFGYLPVGDFRMALVALSESNGDNILRQLFLYRFDKGSGLAGHNFGNLFLTALTEILGSEKKAFEYASKILRVHGKVIPITNNNVTLVAEYENGEILVGETFIDEPPKRHDGTSRIKKLKIQPKANIFSRAKDEILEADAVIIGPGDLYTSLIANLVIEGVSSSLNKTKAKIIYIMNLMTKYGQTHNFSAKDHINEIKKYIGRYPDYVLVNKNHLPKEILKKYKEESAYPVVNDLKSVKEYKVITRDFLAPEFVKKSSGDKLKRSLIRHDSKKLAKVIAQILSS